DIGALALPGFLMALHGAAEDGLDPRFQLTGAKRFYDIVVSTDFKTLNSIGNIGDSSEHNDRRVRSLANFAADFIAVELGQHDVENDQIGLETIELLQRFLPIGGGGNGVPGQF